MAFEDRVEAEEAAQPLAWGQLIVGGVIGGFALWSLALQVFDITPAAVLAGVEASYRAWRDWALTPLLAQFDIVLTSFYSDVLAYVAVMTAAWVRTALRYPAAWRELIDLVLWPSLAAASIYYFVPAMWSPSFGAEMAIGIAAIICTMDLFVRPFAGLSASLFVDERTAAHLAALKTPAARYGFWNASAALALAGGLFAVDWVMR